MSTQIVSRQRVADHGEVLTSEREVNAMLDLVKQETERIDSRFLEPACGTGNFLSEILNRKLGIVRSRYRRSQLDYERNAILAVSSIYGIDILEDNVFACRERLFDIFDAHYSREFKRKARNECREAARFILSRNIVWGDALTLMTADDDPRPIVFSEWSLASGSQMKRRDYAFQALLDDGSLWNGQLVSDLGERSFIPTPVKEYPLTHFLEVADADEHDV